MLWFLEILRVFISDESCIKPSNVECDESSSTWGSFKLKIDETMHKLNLIILRSGFHSDPLHHKNSLQLTIPAVICRRLWEKLLSIAEVHSETPCVLETHKKDT